jgi:hypothetical protein
VRRILLVLVAAVLSVLCLAPPASAEDIQGTDPANDVPYDHGDITFFRATHSSAKLNLRVRTAAGGNPETTWPNTNTYIRWNIDTVFATPGPEYYAYVKIGVGVDVVMIGRVRRASDDHLMCSAQNHVPGNNVVSQSGNLYRFAFLRGCIGAPAQVRVRATFQWDNANPGGAIHTDYAPNSGPTQPLDFF